MILRRRKGDGSAPVEFLATEESPVPATDSPPAGPSSRRYLLLSAVVLMGAALLIGRSGTDDPTASAPEQSASGPLTPDVDPQRSSDPAKCPGPHRCPVSPDFPDAAAAALVQEFPGARLGPAATVRLPSGELWFRQLTARAGTLNLAVRIQQSAAVAPLEPTRSDTAITYVRQQEHGFVVQIEADGPRSDLPEISRLYRLAADLRLVAPG